MAVRLDDGRRVAFHIETYAVDHGYAATIHKAQGVTVDRAHVLSSSGAGPACGLRGAQPSPGRGVLPLRGGSVPRLPRAGVGAEPGAGEGHHARLPESFAERRGISVLESLQRAAGRALKRPESGFEKSLRELAGAGEAPRPRGAGSDERRHAAELMAGVRSHAAARRGGANHPPGIPRHGAAAGSHAGGAECAGERSRRRRRPTTGGAVAQPWPGRAGGDAGGGGGSDAGHGPGGRGAAVARAAGGVLRAAWKTGAS